MPKGVRLTEQQKEAIRQDYLSLSRVETVYARKKQGPRVKHGGLIQELIQKHGISLVTLWRVTYDLHSWNQGRVRP